MAERPLQQLIGALALLNRSIPLGDELADGANAAIDYATGRAASLPQAWDQARARSSAAARSFDQAHPVAGDLLRGAGIALQAAPFLATGGTSAAPAAAARPGLIESIGRGAVAGGLGAQIGGLAGEGDLPNRASDANRATPAAMAAGGALPAGVDLARRASLPAPVARLTGEELATFDAPIELLRRAARDHYNGLRGQTFPMAGAADALTGFNRVGRDKVMSFSADPDKLRVVAALPETIEKGSLVSSSSPHKPVAPDVKAFHTVEAPISLAGERRIVRNVIRETKDGRYHYDHTVLAEPEPSGGGGMLDRLLQTLAGVQGSAVGSN